MIKTDRSRLGSASRLIAVTGLMAMLFALLPAGSAMANHLEGITRVQANSAVEAAIAYSNLLFPDDQLADGTVTAPDEALIGRNDLFPDNLASGALQDTDTPLLYTDPTELPPETAEELQRLGVDSVTILGGTDAVSEQVEAELEDLVGSVSRLAGPTRIETAIEVTESTNATTAVMTRAYDAEGGSDTAAWADSLAAGAWAAEAGYGVLLTTTGELADTVVDFLQGGQIDTVIVIGGTEAISEAAEQELSDLVDNVRRVSGVNRAATAVEIAEARGFPTADAAPGIFLVEGYQNNAWASGFAAAALSAQEQFPIVLSNDADLPPETVDYLTATDGTDGAATQAVDSDLICGAFVVDAACTEAAALLGIATIQLDVTTVEAGQQVTGVVLGDVASLTVSGCGLTDQDVTIGDDDAFAFTIPGGQPAGDCQLTFTITTADGETITRTVTIEVTAAAGPVTLATTTVQAGGTITGNVAGDVQQVRVSGCGLTEQDVVLDAEGDFTLTIPASQAGGTCELTFVSTLADGTTVTQTFTITVTAPVSVSEAPELVSARIADATTGVVEYTFDEAVFGAASTPSFFRVYTFAGVMADGDTARIEGNSVFVQFTPAELQNVTLATVYFDAVIDANGRGNPEGDAAIANVVQAAGITAAPDLVSVGNFRIDATGQQFVDYTFDEDIATVGPAANYLLILQDNTQEVGVTATRTAPRVVTVNFGNIAVNEIAFSQVARGVALSGAACDAAGNCNPLQAADVGFAGNTVDPDLASAQVLDSDTVRYIFDEGVDAFNLSSTPCPIPPAAGGTGSCFVLYDASAEQFAGDVAERVAGNPNAVDVTFAGTTVSGLSATRFVAQAVGASVLDRAVRATDNVNTPNLGYNQEDEVPLQQVAFEAGRTLLPDLLAAEKLQDLVTQNRTVRYTFDAGVCGADGVINTADDLVVPEDFKLYDMNGNRFVGNAILSAADNCRQVVVEFDDAQVEAAVIATVADADAAPVTPAPNIPLFPEGAVQFPGVDTGA